MYLRSKKNISIHAPSRERHCLFCKRPRCLKISIHAPSRERRKCSLWLARRYRLFQSTLPRGSDVFYHQALTVLTISIHAPSRERRFGFALAVKFLNLFQSTLPRGSDLTKSTTNSTSNNFNPRSLAGATARTMMMSRHRSISIHAPSRERPNSKGRKVSLRNFNPRSLAGATSD